MSRERELHTFWYTPGTTTSSSLEEVESPKSSFARALCSADSTSTP